MEKCEFLTLTPKNTYSVCGLTRRGEGREARGKHGRRVARCTLIIISEGFMK